MMFYLAGAIDLSSDNSYKEMMLQSANELGICTFDPKGAFSISNPTKEDAEKLMSINEKAMLTCDGVVFLFDESTPSIGTPIELKIANMKNVPNIVIYVTDSIDGMVPMYITGLADEIHVTSRSGMQGGIDYGIRSLKKRIDLDKSATNTK